MVHKAHAPKEDQGQHVIQNQVVFDVRRHLSIEDDRYAPVAHLHNRSANKFQHETVSELPEPTPNVTIRRVGIERRSEGKAHRTNGGDGERAACGIDW